MTYTVKSGDSLSKIAQNLLGNGSRYPEIVQANATKYPGLVKNPNLIYPGMALEIPDVVETAIETKTEVITEPITEPKKANMIPWILSGVAMVAGYFLIRKLKRKKA